MPELAGLNDLMSVAKFAARPPVSLRPFVERIWSWEARTGVPLPVLMPGTGADLFIHFASPFGVVHDDGRVMLSQVHLTCLRSLACRLVATGPVGFVAVRFRSSALRHFGTVAMADLLDRFPDASEVLGRDIEAMPDRLAGLPDFAARSAVVADYLTARLAKCGAVYGRGDRAADALYYGTADSRIADIADSLGYSDRQFERDVRYACGISPKRFARVCRLHHTVRSVLVSGRRDTLDSALKHGYYDQAHFLHEFKSLTGMRPCDFFTPAAFVSHFYNTKWQS